MALTKEVKQELIGKHGRNEADTGSPEVQIAMLTQRINDLTEHLRTHAEGPLLPARALEARRPAAAVPELHAEARPRGLSRPHQGARPQALALTRESGSLDEASLRSDPNFHSPPSRVEDME